MAIASMRFPSVEQRAALLQKCRTNSSPNTLKFAVFTNDERAFWHAYDYGWRRVVLEDYTPTSPIDRDGLWYDGALAYAAELHYRAKFNRPKPGGSP